MAPDLTDLTTIKQLLTYYNLSANKKLGQHFLTDKSALASTLTAADLSPSDYVVEVGPGFGTLTTTLAEHAGKERVVVVGRELTKIHEEVRRGPLQAVLVHYRLHPPLGEVTLALAGLPAATRESPDEQTIEFIQVAVREWLASGESRREVVRRVTAEFGLPRNDAYRLVMDT